MPADATELARPTSITIIGDSHVFALSDRLFRIESGETFLFRALYCPGLRTIDFVQADGTISPTLLTALQVGRVLVGHGTELESAHATGSAHWRWVRQLEDREGADTPLVIAAGTIDVLDIWRGITEPDITLPASLAARPTTPAVCRTVAPGALSVDETISRFAAPLEPLRTLLRFLRERGMSRIAVLGLPPTSLDDAACDEGYAAAGFTPIARASTRGFRYKSTILVSEMLRRLCGEEAVAFVDRFTPFTEDGLARPDALRDFVHLSSRTTNRMAADIIDALELGGGARGADIRGDGHGDAEPALHGDPALEKARLDTVYALASAPPGSRVLELGCGRGELGHAFSSRGANVTALDSSPAAIRLARATAGDAPIRYVIGSATAFIDDGGYDVVVAADLVEHLTPNELDRVYANLAAMVRPTGTFIIRSASHALRRPRPNLLRRALRSAFEHVLVWVGTNDDPGGSLGRRFTVREFRDANDVYAVASHVAIDAESILQRITTSPLEESDAVASLARLHVPTNVRAGEPFAAAVTLRNDGTATLASFAPNPVRFAYWWTNDDGIVGDDRGRSRIALALEPGAERRYRLQVEPPAEPGTYTLNVSLVQEFVRWFESSAELTLDVR